MKRSTILSLPIQLVFPGYFEQNILLKNDSFPGNSNALLFLLQVVVWNEGHQKLTSSDQVSAVWSNNIWLKWPLQ
jgi:hypothetical protein